MDPNRASPKTGEARPNLPKLLAKKISSKWLKSSRSNRKPALEAPKIKVGGSEHEKSRKNMLGPMCIQSRISGDGPKLVADITRGAEPGLPRSCSSKRGPRTAWSRRSSVEPGRARDCNDNAKPEVTMSRTRGNNPKLVRPQANKAEPGHPRFWNNIGEPACSQSDDSIGASMRAMPETNITLSHRI